MNFIEGNINQRINDRFDKKHPEEIAKNPSLAVRAYGDHVGYFDVKEVTRRDAHRANQDTASWSATPGKRAEARNRLIPIEADVFVPLVRNGVTSREAPKGEA